MRCRGLFSVSANLFGRGGRKASIRRSAQQRSSSTSPTAAQRATQTSSSTPKNVETNLRMLSSVTNVPFSEASQKTLREAAKKNNYSSRYWVTLPQSQRTSNATVLPGEKPTIIHLHVHRVIPLTSLSPSTQKRILDECPPFFGSGVGILSDRKKWRAVTAERLLRVLNKGGEDRVLYVDVDMTETLNIKYKKSDVIDIRHASSVAMYNAEQLDDPYKGAPQKGLALNAVSGKRVGQPAHDILLGVGILRGYTSPMWVAEQQLRHLNLEIDERHLGAGVVAPDMTGLIVSLSAVPTECKKVLLAELKATRPDAFGYDLFFIYNVNGWEVSRSRILVKHMSQVDDATYPFHFVNLASLAIQKPEYAAFVSKALSLHKPIGPSLLDVPKGADGSESRVRVEAGEAVQTGRINERRVRFFFSEDATLRRYFNAACMTKPYLTVPSVRPIAIFNGKLLGPRDESILRTFSIEHKLSSPIWVTEQSVRRLGVRISPKYRKKYVLIGAAAADTSTADSDDGFYNIDDFADPEEVLELFPKASKSVHFMLDSKWRPVLGKQRQDFLSSLGRKRPLWVSENECLMSGFRPNTGVAAIRFPTRKSGKVSGGMKLYNSQHTTDPVRVVGLSTVFNRPQGLKL